MDGFVIRIVGGPARDEGVQVAVDSVTSAPDAIAHLLRGALEPVAVGSGYDEWSPTRGPERGCLDARPQPRGQQRLAVVGQHQQPEHRAHPARELARTRPAGSPERRAAAGHRRAGRRRQVRARRARAPCRPGVPTRGRREDVGACGDLTSLPHQPQPLAPRGHALGERAVGPGMCGHRRQVGAEHDDARLTAAGRASARHELGAQRVGELGIADEAVAAPPPGRPRLLAVVGHAVIDDLVGQHARRHAHQLAGGQLGGVDGGGAERRLGAGVHQLEVGPAAARGGGGQHGLAERLCPGGRRR